MSCQECGARCGSDESCACACGDPHLEPAVNRAGLEAIGARLGDFHDFFGDALRRLGDASLPALRDLGTRDGSDPAIAWLDAWSIAADVLTFYRERLTNEGYLRTARDEQALRELAALVGYKPRPGVAATAYLSYLMEATAAPVPIPAGAKAQSVPAPGERMQTFETEEPFTAHAGWSQMTPRITRPPGITLVDAMVRPSLRLAGTTLVVRPGERVLFVFDDKPAFQVAREVTASRIDILAGHIDLDLKPHLLLSDEPNRKLAQGLEALRDDIATHPTPVSDGLLILIASYMLGGSAADGSALAARIQEVATTAAGKAQAGKVKGAFDEIRGAIPVIDLNAAAGPSSLDDVLVAVNRARPRQLTSARQLTTQLGRGLSANGPDRVAVLEATTPGLADALAATLDALPASAAPANSSPKVYLLRTTAHAFGAFAPLKFTAGDVPPVEYELEGVDNKFLFLDAVYDGIVPRSYGILDMAMPSTTQGHFELLPERALFIFKVTGVETVSRRAYDMTAKSSRLEYARLDAHKAVLPLFGPGGGLGEPPPKTPLTFVRNFLYHVQSEEVTLAGDVEDVDVSGHEIVLQSRVDPFQPGQWVIVAGERTDIADANQRPVPGVRAAELAMIAAVDQTSDEHAPNDTLHTVITLVKDLAYSYKRSSTVVYGNVVKASHGETVSEVLGSGDASRAGQQFAFKRGPLTFTTAATPEGAESSETVRVNGTRYQQVDSLLDASPAARAYEMDVDADGLATLTFGDGELGARLPSGTQNVRADYRAGIGSAGNVGAAQISVMTTRPLGVTGVVNPLRTTGGADRDGAERIRQNVPIATRGLSHLSRLVSVDDYANFARRFAGIGHADAVRLSDGAQQLVFVTVAGVDDSPLDEDSELLANLRDAYARFGDPTYPVEIEVRALKVLLIEARVAAMPDADWEIVEPELRQRVRDAFAFDRRRLGQSAYLSEAVMVMQNAPGVDWVDVDRFGGLTEAQIADAAALAEAIKGLTAEAIVYAEGAGLNPKWTPGSKQPRFVPSQLAFLPPNVPGLLVLNRV